MGDTRHPVLIVGGGLAGLTAAYRLHQANIGFLLLEARGRFGGRILSLDQAGDASDDGFDLGPSWFWPHVQPALVALIDELGLPTFAQHEEGDVVFERMSREQPLRYRSTSTTAQSMRLVGGTSALVAALAARLPDGSIRRDCRVGGLRLAGETVEAEVTGPHHQRTPVRADRAILALPPRLIEASISFEPALDAATTQAWRGAATWMAPHAKFFAIYDRPFWRDAGLSGTAQSMVGPLAEIHDATTASGRAALFGFVALTALDRAAIGEEAIAAAAIRQFARLFGPEARTPRATLFKDWSADPLTATAGDLVASGHLEAGVSDPRDDAWQNRIFLAGSESSDSEPGYLSGAVTAATRAVKAVMASSHDAAARRRAEP